MARPTRKKAARKRATAGKTASTPSAPRKKNSKKKAAAAKKGRTSAKKATADRTREPVPRLPRPQLTLPAGYLADGAVATLRQVLSPQVTTRDGMALNDDERRRLTMLRIEAQPKFSLVGPDGLIDKARALDEVQRGTPLGRILVAVEHRTIEFVRDTAAVQQHRRRALYREGQRLRAAAPRARTRHR